MSTYSEVIDDVILDLQENVPALAVDAVLIHRYAPQNAALLDNDGSPHLAVYPFGERAETISPAATDSVFLTEAFRVLYWEPAGSEASRGITDEDAALAMLALVDAIRDRFMVTANEGGTGRAWRTVWTAEVRFGMGGQQASSLVRWFETAFQAQFLQPYT